MKNQNLHEDSKHIEQILNGDIVDINKQFASIFKEAKENAKLTKCFYCGKPVTSFCNSHSVPAFCLRNISKNGRVLNINSIIKFPFFLKESSGVNNTGTFQIICNECDNTVFKDYENPELYKDTQPSDVALAEIALKCNLKFISKRLKEIELYNLMGKKQSNNEIPESVNAVNMLDLNDYIQDLTNSRKVLSSKVRNAYYLFYYKVLPYKTPIACQSQIALYSDFDGNIVNDIYNTDKNYHMKDLYVCVFPLEYSTAVLLFIDNNEKRYKGFYKRFNKLSDEDKLSVINYILFLYTEDFYFSEVILDSIKSNKQIECVTELTSNLGLSLEELLDPNIKKQRNNVFA